MPFDACINNLINLLRTILCLVRCCENTVYHDYAAYHGGLTFVFLAQELDLEMHSMLNPN